jgi:hypothetical protein
LRAWLTRFAGLEWSGRMSVVSHSPLIGQAPSFRLLLDISVDVPRTISALGKSDLQKLTEFSDPSPWASLQDGKRNYPDALESPKHGRS